MKVEGVDPVVLQQVQARAEQQAELTQTRESRIRTEQQQDQERRFGTETFEQQLQRAVRQLNETSDLFQIRLRFKIDEETGDIYVLVIDREKGEIIRRIPPEKVISMVYQLEYMIGLLLDELV
ncbi:MAG: flagellar protein FlaG [Clostridia bacterium]|nr:flagellar protein FlaG [Clostridia bacterium]